MEPADQTRYKLQRMNLSGKNPYVCLIPPPIESHTHPVEEPQLEANPAQTWSLLQPLSGSCLYVRAHVVQTHSSSVSYCTKQ